ncbi:unnamed protein product [Blepharisma stoltei]|uniref:Uncharacterized protein n=1 Tax=Blepharisma stoltei TaxID=1481888 RepID=A0AAU9IQ07_9CILI|nr:unnamed protein product [Blepharisma stoltei]
MCKFNVECKEGEGTCCCPENAPCKGFTPVQGIVCPQPMRLPKTSMPPNCLVHILQQQSTIIRMLAEQNEVTNKKLACVLAKLESLGPKDTGLPLVELPEESTSSRSLLSTLCGSTAEFQYSIKLTSEIPSPVFKERAFTLTAQIVDLQGNEVQLADHVQFKIMLFTSENPPKVLTINTSGDKIMRGTVEVESSSQIVFSKIVIKEVTSHFRNGCFFLVVNPVGMPSIKPLIIDNLVIKARKVNPEGNPRKKIKTEMNIEVS